MASKKRVKFAKEYSSFEVIVRKRDGYAETQETSALTFDARADLVFTSLQVTWVCVYTLTRGR